MQHAASVLAELLDNDNDGCADDPKVLASILKKVPNVFAGSPASRRSLFLMDSINSAFSGEAAEKLGYLRNQLVYEDECLPKFSGLKAKDQRDATLEEWMHFINDFGHHRVYPKIFGNKWTSNSALTKAMDIAR